MVDGVVHADGCPVDERRKDRDGTVGIDRERLRDIVDPHAAGAVDIGEHVGEQIVVDRLHAADAVVAAEQDRRDAELGAVALALERDAGTRGHAEEELGHADIAEARHDEVAELVDAHEQRQDDDAPEDGGKGSEHG